MKLSYMRLMVDDFDACFEFYSDALGLEVTWGQKGDVYASFKGTEGVQLAIFKAELMDSHIEHTTENRKQISDKMMLVFESDNLDESYARFVKLGVSCINTPHEMPGWGIRCMHLRDPEGNLIELNQELPKEQWSADLLEDADKYE